MHDYFEMQTFGLSPEESAGVYVIKSFFSSYTLLYVLPIPSYI